MPEVFFFGSSSDKAKATIHLLAVASWFGCTAWVSLVAGIVTFKTLPRHVFGRLQSRLFPVYFRFSTVLLVVAIATTASGPLMDDDRRHHLPRSLLVILGMNLLNQIWFEPATTRIMIKRHAVEKRLGTGHEVGKLKPDDPIKANDPELVALSRSFGMLHGISTLLTLGGMAIGCYWLSVIADRLVSTTAS
mmetsp:Transcript_11980/g.28418  ORF Transcript_11980/g.28418 Transcript_11980/m.28418 type:complete len:191 (-) Transcript_11980:289-861(-)|eukprot:CAMPEP_0197182454 /NCGR_PEP_ID=MMETSP1423-20130617/6404_1 /TAXON_ID=476441 /ORGANISM="Pseudo-nitzschia heimii, Strain UNC1101" /LENGTH=190 /DNA_ID=CAMNT_0042632875 /DNA_START=175 /DNA_END=747 /DNA_ORIENTATION=+